MSTAIPQSTLDKFTTFGDLLRYLRRRAGITQVELSIAVGYSTAQICRLEQNLRLPDPPTIEARFVPALFLEEAPQAVARLLELAATVQRENAPEPGMCPYKGLEYFDESDAGLFVGRESLTAKLTKRVLSLALRNNENELRFLAIVGASGSGKSSLVRAGLVPALRWDKRSANWQMHIFTPTAHPLESLATTLHQENGSIVSITTMMDDLIQDPRCLGLYIKRDLKASGAAYILLVIDQFEELFSLCHSEKERSALIDNLHSLSLEAEAHAIVTITLRADFYANCAAYPLLRNALASNQEYIGTMSDEEMRRAIEEPALRGHWVFEPGLVDLILHDVGHEPGALPLLSHALLETWQRRHGRTMTLSGYTSAGGVRGAIAETAETVFTDQFTREQQAIARRIFLRLTELGDETASGDTRRRATLKELVLKPEDSDATQGVLKALADARLVTTAEDSVQVAHEALIREWPTLRGWLEDNREGLRLHRQLTEAAQDWESAGHEPDSLFRGVRLAQAGEWATVHPDDMNALEKEFLQASIADSEREAAEREAARQRELEAAQKLVESESRSSKKLRRRAIYLSAALLITLIFVVLAVMFARQANINAQLALSGQEKADIASTLAINESLAHATAEVAALSQRSTAQAASTKAIDQSNIRATAEERARAEADINLSLSLAAAAQEANSGGRGDLALALALEAVKISPSLEEAEKALRTVALGTGTRAVFHPGTQPILAVAISTDGKTAFFGSCAQLDEQGACQEGELFLWDLVASKEIRHWTGHAGMVTAVAMSQDGQTLISGGADGVILLWQPDSTLQAELGKQEGTITGLSIVSDIVKLLSSSDNGMLTLWDIAKQQKLMDFDATNSPINDLAVAGKAPRAVTGHQDGSVILWDLASPHPLFRVNQGDRINAVELNSDASRIYLTMGDKTFIFMRMLNGQDGAKLNEYTISTLNSALALSPDESYLLIPILANLIQFDLNKWSQQGILCGPEKDITAISTSQDGRLAISGSANGELRVWNLGDQLDIRKIMIPHDEFTSLDISPDGNYLALNDAAKDGFSRPVLWDIAASRVITTYLGFDGSLAPNSLKFSPDGHYLAAAGAQAATSAPLVMIWDVKTGQVKCQREDFKIQGRVVAFSPDSAHLLAGSQDPDTKMGELILYNIRNCAVEQIFDPQGDVATIAFSSDGAKAVTGAGYYSRAILWDVATATQIRQLTYPFQGGPVVGLAFGPDDTTILGSGFVDLYLWDVETGEIIRSFSGFSPFPWNVDLSSDGKYVVSGMIDGTLILWDFNSTKELYRVRFPDMVNSVAFSPDSKTIYAASGDGTLSEWNIAEKSLPELLDWINANRYIRPLTDAEKIQYHIVP